MFVWLVKWFCVCVDSSPTQVPSSAAVRCLFYCSIGGLLWMVAMLAYASGFAVSNSMPHMPGFVVLVIES
ncbi:hypothetical protein HanOQP8_Chr02g0042061 [Helianthus annuus]|nr:hypothetical protein HanOQP8_Chr02g0042061 [Helianthus annuus]